MLIVNGRSRSSRYLLRFQVIGVAFGHFCFVGGAFVNIEAATKSDALSCGNRQVTSALFFLFTVMQATRTRCKHAVAAYVPCGRMPRDGGIIEHRDSQGLPAAGPPLIAAVGVFSPW